MMMYSLAWIYVKNPERTLFFTQSINLIAVSGRTEISCRVLRRVLEIYIHDHDPKPLTCVQHCRRRAVPDLEWLANPVKMR
jgi:hypothetical protein